MCIYMYVAYFTGSPTSNQISQWELIKTMAINFSIKYIANFCKCKVQHTVQLSYITSPPNQILLLCNIFTINLATIFYKTGEPLCICVIVLRLGNNTAMNFIMIFLCIEFTYLLLLGIFLCCSYKIFKYMYRTISQIDRYYIPLCTGSPDLCKFQAYFSASL